MKFPNRRITRRETLAGAARAAVVAGVASPCQQTVASMVGKSFPDYEIWDMHGHLNSAGDTPREKISDLLRVADRMGIERVIVFMGYPWSYEPTPDDMRRQNDQVIEAVGGSGGRAYGFVYLNPRHTDASVAEMDRCIQGGPLIGVKLWVAVRCFEECLDPIVEHAVELRAPVLQHTWYKVTGNLQGESTSEDLATLAARHPKASFISAHSGGDWEIGIRAIRHLPNVTAEICGGDPTTGFVDMAVRELGAERVMYGSDFAGRSFASQLAKVYGADISEDAKRLILAGNIRRMLAPVFQAKGMKP